MAELNSVFNKNSRYVSGGQTEVNPTALEWWERNILPVNTDDNVYVVEKRFEGRLDQIAASFLNDPKLWWVIAQYNNILDPYSEIFEGSILLIPTIEKVKALLNGKTGGYPSQREVPLSILPIV